MGGVTVRRSTEGPTAVPAPTPQGVQASHLRKANGRAVLKFLRTRSETTTPEIAAHLGLSRPTVSSALGALQVAGLVKTRGVRSGQSGRAPTLWSINARAGVVAGLDVGTNWVRAAVADLNGTQVAEKRVALSSRTFEDVLGAIDAAVDGALEAADVGRSQLIHTVIGSPGVVDPVAGRILFSPNLPGWEDERLHAELRLRFTHFTIEKDVYLAALGEVQIRSTEESDFLLVTVGRGLSAAVVQDGTPLRGRGGRAGEIGYVTREETTPDRDRVPLFDNLEQRASADALLDSAAQAGPRFASIQELFDAAPTNPDAARAVEEEAIMIASAIALMVLVTDPPAVILTGSIGLSGGARFADQVKRFLDAQLPFEGPSVQPSRVGENAIVAGALATSLDAGWQILTEMTSPAGL